MDLAALGLTLDGKGAITTLNIFTGSAANAGRATEHFERTTKNLTAAMRGLGGFFALRQLAEYADTWTLIGARVALVTKDMDQQITVQKRLYDIAQLGRNTLAATSVLYTRLALGANELGRSQNELLKVVAAVNNGLLISGSTGVEAAQSMRQLAQAFSKGKLDGDEFRTVMEAMPTVAQALADHLKVTRGELLNLAPQGKLRIQDILDALLEKSDEFEKKARAMPLTLGQAFGMLSNAITQSVGKLNQATGVTKFFGQMIWFAKDGMDKILPLVLSLGAATLGYAAAVMAVKIAYELLTLWVNRAAIQMAILDSLMAVKIWFEFAAGIRTAADAMALFQLVSGGAAKALATVVAVGIGYLAYRVLTNKIAAENAKMFEAMKRAEAGMDTPMGKRVDPGLSAAALKALEKAKEANEDRVRLAEQTLVLSGLDEIAQKRIKLQFDAVNDVIKTRRDLTGSMLAQTEQAIQLELELRQNALLVEETVKKAVDAAKERAQIIGTFADDLQRKFADTFTQILKDGIRSFGDLFKAIRDMFFRLVAEMVSAQLMKKIGGTVTAILSGMLSTPADAKAQRLAEIMKSAAMAHEASAMGMSGGMTAAGENGTRIPVVRIAGIDVSVQKSFASQMAAYIAPVLAGFAAGAIAGNMTSNKYGGSLVGMAGGIAGGFATGGVPGAIIGGLTGAISGWVTSSKKHAEELKLNREAVYNNSLKLQALRDAFNGVSGVSRLQEQLDALRKWRTYMNNPSDRESSPEALLIKKAANDLGITLFVDGKYVKGSLEQLNQALALSIKALTQFGNNLSDQQKKIEAYNKLFDVPDTPLQSLTDSYSLLKTLAPDLLKKLGLENIDLTTEAGRLALTKGLQAIYNLIISGQLTPDLLGAFANKGELIDAIIKSKDALNKFDQALTKVTTDFPRAMDIPFFEQKFGHYGLDAPKGTPTTETSGGITVNGDIVIQTDSSEDGEAVLQKVEAAARQRGTRGGQSSFGTTF